MKKSLKAFIFLSLAIALLEVAFVALAHHQQKLALDESLQEKIEQVESSFELGLLNAEQQVSELARYVASFPAVRQLFLSGRLAVEYEGGGAGGAEAAKIRSKLLTVSQDTWYLLDQSFDFLQMNYHLPGKATSFLRVHKPEKYGDQLTPFRQMLVDAHASQRLISGLELDHVDMHVRGIAPVFAYDESLGQDMYVGTLELATSLKQVVDAVAANQGIDLAVVVDLAQLETMLWPEQLEKKKREKGVSGNFLVEETSFEDGTNFLQGVDIDALKRVERTDVHPCKSGGYHWLASFPLRDYWGEKDLGRPAIGRVVLSSDATESYLVLEANLHKNIILALLGFIVIEILLWLALQLTAWKLERMVEAGRVELEEKNRNLEIALDEVKTLSGLVPICSYCKKIRDDDGYWNRLEHYIETNTEAQFSHGICDECVDEHFPGARDQIEKDRREGGD